jgi:hypothetical protein
MSCALAEGTLKPLWPREMKNTAMAALRARRFHHDLELRVRRRPLQGGRFECPQALGRRASRSIAVRGTIPDPPPRGLRADNWMDHTM